MWQQQPNENVCGKTRGDGVGIQQRHSIVQICSWTVADAHRLRPKKRENNSVSCHDNDAQRQWASAHILRSFWLTRSIALASSAAVATMLGCAMFCINSKLAIKQKCNKIALSRSHSFLGTLRSQRGKISRVKERQRKFSTFYWRRCIMAAATAYFE